MRKLSIFIMKCLSCLLILLCPDSLAASSEGILVEAESFAQVGGWSVDQQFMDLMGSPYLIAHGMGKPVADASTVFKVDESGTYHIYARTFNWVSPWTESEGPGAFRIQINGKALKAVLGTAGNQWMWQYAGSVKLKAGNNAIALSDLKGFDGRCDAIWITPFFGELIRKCKRKMAIHIRHLPCPAESPAAPKQARHENAKSEHFIYMIDKRDTLFQ